MMKGKVKQAVYFMREWIQQDSARFGADSCSKFCSTIKLGKHTVEANLLRGLGLTTAQRSRYKCKGIGGRIKWTVVTQEKVAHGTNIQKLL